MAVKRRRNSKTYWFAGLLGGFGALQVALPDVREAIPPEWYPVVLVAVAAIVAALREVTGSPIGKQ